MDTYSVLGVSSGGGVSLYPFKEHVVGNIEGRPIFHTPKEEQWKTNFGDVPFLRGHSGKERRVNVILSSPDCGSGSILRYSRSKKLGDHKKNDSLALFFTGIDLYKPEFFLFENLEGLFKSFPEKDFDERLSGYRLIKHIAPVTMWGNSQINRKRLIIVGVRKDQHHRYDNFFRLPDMRDRNKTCKEIYGDLNFRDIPMGHVREDSNELTTIHAGLKMRNFEITQTWLNRLAKKRRWEVDPALGKKFDTAPGVYRNRNNDYPATARKASRQYDHMGNMLTPRQLARIQGVPDDFKLYINPDKLNYWINKTRALVTKTPPMEISQWFKRKIDKIWQLKIKKS